MNSEDKLYKKITLRLIPFLVLLYLVAYIDRSVLAFAKLHMNVDVGISDAAYGFGAGLFFVGYILFELPSNVMLVKVGARRWFARIIFTWGVITCLMAMIQGPTSFYVLRFLLGAAEAGFYPGVLYYLTLWYPTARRGRIYGYFAFAQPLAPMLGGPLSGLLLGLNGTLGFHGWQWLFVLCGLPAVLLALPTLKWLPETPRNAKWLRADEAAWVQQQIDKDAARIVKSNESHSPLSVLTDSRVLMLAFAYVPIPLAIYGLSLWLPTIIKGFNSSDLATGFLSAIPFLFGVVGLLIVPRSSDIRNERFVHTIVCSLMSLIGLVGAALASSLALQLACLCMTGFGLYSASAVLWTLPGRFLTGARAAAGLAIINSIGNLGGYLGPFGVGMIKEYTGSLVYGLYFLAATLVLTVVLVLRLRNVELGKTRAQRLVS
jgi:D-galactonate transporter